MREGNIIGLLVALAVLAVLFVAGLTLGGGRTPIVHYHAGGTPLKDCRAVEYRDPVTGEIVVSRDACAKLTAERVRRMKTIPHVLPQQ